MRIGLSKAAIFGFAIAAVLGPHRLLYSMALDDGISERIQRLNQIARASDQQEVRANAIFILMTRLLRDGTSSDLRRVLQPGAWTEDLASVPSVCFGVCSYLAPPGSAYLINLFPDSRVAEESSRRSWALALKFSKVLTKAQAIQYLHGESSDPELSLQEIACITPIRTQVFRVGHDHPLLVSDKLFGEPDDVH